MDKKVDASGINVWRIHANTSAGNVFEYFMRENIAALGWSLCDTDKVRKDPHKFTGNYKELEEAVSAIEKCYINDKDDCKDRFKVYDDLYKKHYNKSRQQYNIRRMLLEIKPNDLIWGHYNGKYYIGRVTEESKYIFNASYDAVYNDACNQITDIEWLPKNGLDESEVAGAITTAFIQGSTLQRINGVNEFSGIIYNSRVNEKYYEIEYDKINKQDRFYSWISPSDCEDLLCFWLYDNDNFKYICIPSTNKKSTQTYECVLLDTKSKSETKQIYIQVKNGNVDLKINNAYKELLKNGELWLLTTKGKVFDESNNEIKFENNEDYKPVTNYSNGYNIYAMNPQKLYEYAMKGDSLIPPAVKTIVGFIKSLTTSQN